MVTKEMLKKGKRGEGRGTWEREAFPGGEVNAGMEEDDGEVEGGDDGEVEGV